MTTPVNFVPITSYIESWPEDFLSSAASGGFLSRVGLHDTSAAATADGYRLTYQLYLCSSGGSSDPLDGGGLELAVLPGVSAWLGAPGADHLFSVYLDRDADGLALGFDAIDGGLRFPAGELLVPAVLSGSEWIAQSGSQLELEGTLSAELRLSPSGAQLSPGAVTLSLGATGVAATETVGVMLGSSGIVIHDVVVSLDLTPASGDVADGGVVIESAQVTFPSLFGGVTEVSLQSARLAREGFSGTLAIDVASATGLTLLGMSFVPARFSIAFADGSPSAVDVAGTITLPALLGGGALDVELSLDDSGNWLLSGDPEEDLTFSLDYATVAVSALGLGGGGGDYYLEIDGSLTLDNLASYGIEDAPSLDFEGLQIRSDGTLALEGAWLDLRESRALRFHGFSLEVDRVGFGVEGGEIWVALDVTVTLADLLPAAVSTRGLVVRWAPGGAPSVSLDGLGVSFAVPHVLSASGEIAFGDWTPGGVSGSAVKGFHGSLDISLEALPSPIGLSVSLGVGRYDDGTTAYGFWQAAFDLPLPVPPPLGNTGLALYSISGEIACNMEPAVGDTSAADFDWYTGWIQPGRPWTYRKGGFGFGAGLTIGTLDGGYSFSLATALSVALPGPLVVLTGEGNFARPRSQLAARSPTPIFSAYAVVDGENASLRLGLHALYEALADLVEIEGGAEAYFSFADPSQWHLWVGQKDENRQVRATLVELLRGGGYVLVDRTGLDLGGHVEIGDSWQAGPVSATMRLETSLAATVSAAPVEGQAELGAEAEVRVGVFGFDLGFGAQVALAVSAPSPFEASATGTLIIYLPWPCDDIELSITLGWGTGGSPSAATPLLRRAGAKAYKSDGDQELGAASTESSWDSAFVVYASGSTVSTALSAPEQALLGRSDLPLVPLDVVLALHFDRPIEDESGVPVPAAAAATEYVVSSSRQYAAYSYRLTRLALYALDTGTSSWTLLSGPQATWQLGTSADGEGATELLVNSLDPFAGTSGSASIATDAGGEGSSSLIDWIVDRLPDYPYSPPVDPVTVYTCVDPTPTDQPPAGPPYTKNGVQIWTVFPAAIFHVPSGGTGVALLPVSATVPFRVVLPSPVFSIRLSIWSRYAVPAALRVSLGATSGSTFTALAVTTYDLALGAQQIEIKQASSFPEVRLEVLGPARAAQTALTLVCWSAASPASEAAAAAAATASAHASESAAITARASELLAPRALLDERTFYRLVATTEVYDLMTSASTPQRTDTHSAYFYTNMPPDDLAPYVDAISPSADFPHYTGLDLVCTFRESYVEAMMHTSTRNLSFEVLDGEGDTAATAEATWGAGGARLPAGVLATITRYAANGATIAASSAEGVSRARATLSSGALAAGAGYTLRLTGPVSSAYAAGDRSLPSGAPLPALAATHTYHEVPFATSAFSGFDALVASCTSAE
ncbi:MAG: hypothetical protein IT372_16775, partial [Polyangiaceae bacterium]|nr:hypothetical protein [Polyangiaceae bacterium]